MSNDGAVDLLVIGRFTDSACVSATAIGGQVMQTITGIVLGISTGGTVVIGQFIGADKKEAAGRAVGNLTALFVVIAAGLTAVMILLARPVTYIMQTPEEAVEYTVKYVTICSFGIPFIVGYNGVSGVFRGFGDSRTPLYFVALACAINIGLDLLLIAVIPMGVAGAAAATISAQGISFIAAIIYMIKKGLPVPFTKSYIGFKGGQALRILKIGSPIAVQDAFVNISFLIITAVINTMGLVASAAVGIDEKIIVFAMLVPTSFASAVAVMTAQNIGAGKMIRARKGLWVGVALAFIFCVNSFFSGCGYSLFSLIHSMIATFGVRVPVSYFLSKIPGITLFEMGFVPPAATCVSIVLCLIYLNTAKFKVEGEKIISP